MKKKIDIKPGLYKHYKGDVYQILYLADNKSGKGKTVVYKEENSEVCYTRSLENFVEKVVVKGEKKPRFKFVSDISIESWEARCKRALADYQNLLKQVANEKQSFYKYVLEEFLQELLPVYDNLKISVGTLSSEEANNPWVEGIKYVIKQFKELLKNNNIEEIEVINKKFDLETMEAVQEDEKSKEKINHNSELICTKEIMPGYKLNNKVIRPAKVLVKNKNN
jgi:molecular chaperone GrpE (heat shock protein)